jgi:hypothetical protein
MRTAADEWRCQATIHIHPLTEPSTDASHFLADMSSAGGRVECWVERGPRLTMRICPPSAKPYTFSTRQLIFTSDEIFEVALLCDDVKALLWINGQLAGSMGYPLLDEGPLEVLLPEWAESQTSKAQDSCAQASKVAVDARRRRHTQTAAKPNRRPLTKEDMTKSLNRELTQLNELLQLVNLGSADHIYGISARVRSMICYMKNRNDLPLLQYCASFCDLPLLVYITPPHWADYGNRPDVELGGRIYPKRVVGGLLEVDLDFWLFLEMLRHGDTTYTANDVLRSFAEAMGGAHHDKSIDPKIEELFKHSRRTFGSSGIFNQMYAHVLDVAVCVLSLGRQVAGHLDV